MSSQGSAVAPLLAIVFPMSNQQFAISNSCYSSYFLNSREAFVPPKPNEFDRA